jgi:type IV pilus assembly protein PilQ
VQVEAAEVTQVLDLLGEMAGWNVVVAPGVTGEVTLNLRDVTLEEALASVLAPHDLVAERKDSMIFVFPRAQADARAAAMRVVVTKVYRPSYINVADLQALATPLLTETIGKIAVTSPSSTGLELDNTKGGGDTLTQRDALVVQDYPEVLEQIDNIVLEMDVPPVQVVIEGYILRVQLRDNLRFGVNLALLSDEGRQLLTTGSGAAIGTSTGFPGERESLVPPLPQFLGNAAGLRYGFLTGNVTGFIEALESIGETTLVASPSVRVLNKQKAELIIGKRLGYKTQTFNNQQTIENVQFLDVGTKLILRPFAAPDGFIRMEIHPEQSSGQIDINGLPTVDTTEVTSNVMVRDGSTVVIGGLIDEQTEEVVDQVPLLGSIPIVGNAFKTTDERLIRSELIVLITPRIVCDPIEEARGEVLRAETEARAAHFTDSLSTVSRRNLARMHTVRAAELYDKGRLSEAYDHTRKALSIRTNDGDALRLQSRIESSLQDRRRGMFSWPPTFGRSPSPAAADMTQDPGHATLEPSPVLAPPAPLPEASFDSQ